MPFQLKTPEAVGMSSRRLSRIPQVLESYIKEGRIPGAVWLVARYDEIVQMDALGLKAVESRAPASIDTIFRIASMTKPITSTALLMLYDEGRFSLSDPVSRWLPQFRNPMVLMEAPGANHKKSAKRAVPANKAITIKHLLTHTAGLSAVPETEGVQISMNDEGAEQSEVTIGDFVDYYATLPLHFQPGEAWLYSRATCVAGRLVEIISGLPLDVFFRQRIFEPLQMWDTDFFVPIEKADRFSAAYSPAKQGLRRIDSPDESSWFVKKPCPFFMGSGGLVSTVPDYYRFDRMMLHSGEWEGVRFLSSETHALMTQNHTGDLPIAQAGPGMGFGLGYAVALESRPATAQLSSADSIFPWSVGSYTWGGAFCTHHWVDPVEEIIGLIMTQVRPYFHLNLFGDFVELVYHALDKK